MKLIPTIEIGLISIVSMLSLQAANIYYIGGTHSYVSTASDPAGDIWTLTRGSSTPTAGLRPVAGDTLFNDVSNSGLLIGESISLSSATNSVYLVNQRGTNSMTITSHIQGMVTNSGQASLLTLSGNANFSWQVVNSGTDAVLRVYSTGDAATGILATNIQNRGVNSIAEFYSAFTLSGIAAPNLQNSGSGSQLIFRDGADVTLNTGGILSNSATNSSTLLESGSRLNTQSEIQVNGTNSSLTLAQGATIVLNSTAALTIRTTTANGVIDINGTVTASGTANNIYLRDSANLGNLIRFGSTANVNANAVGLSAGSKGTLQVDAGSELTLASGIYVGAADSTLSFNGRLNTGTVSLTGSNLVATFGSSTYLAGTLNAASSGGLTTLLGGTYAGSITNATAANMTFANAGTVTMKQLFNNGILTFSGTQTLSGDAAAAANVNVLETGSGSATVFETGSNTTIGTNAFHFATAKGTSSSLIFKSGSNATVAGYLIAQGLNSAIDIQSGSVVATGGRIQLSGENARVTISGTANIAKDIEVNGTNSTLTIKAGASTVLGGTYFGVRGDLRGSTTNVEGGSLLVAGNFIVAGNDGAQTNSASFNQTGGLVSLSNSNNNSALRLTFNSPTATADYNLSGGTLVVNSAAGSALGITYGAAGSANAHFNWTGGALATSRIDINLDNLGTGRLEVGGIDTVGLFQVATASGALGGGLTYHQGANASAAFDVASASSYDKILWQNASTYSGGGQSTVTLDDGTSLYFNLDAPLTETITLEVIRADVVFVGDTINIYVNGELSDTATWQRVAGADYEALNVTLAAIPEPALAAGVLGALALALAARRRRA